jgi:mannose-1-phosphate guanylyltransferase
MMRDTNFYAVVLVGGKGKRLAPLSTPAKPKAFISITRDRKTMFRRTIDRLKKIIPAENIVVVANKRHAGLVRRDFHDMRKENLLLEPVSRNTAPAILYAAFLLEKRCGDIVMAVIPTDQYVKKDRKQLDCIEKGISFIRKNRDALISLAAAPTYPATGFGYIKISGKPKEGALKAKRFVEKPDLATAKRYLREKKYLWNTGAFIFYSGTIIKQARRFAPEIYDILYGSGNPRASYGRLPDISIDYAIMEKTPDLYCIKGSYGWQDMGTFEAIRAILKKESRRFVIKDGKITKIL